MTAFQSPGRSKVIAANGVVATSHPLGTKIALSMLEEGGNAVDAAIAGAVFLGLAEPAMTGLGGDMFALVKPAGTEDIVGMNASGRAAAGLDPDALRAMGWTAMDRDHAHSVVVPGAVAGFETLSQDYGRKGLAASLAPAIRYFDEGIPVAPRAALDWADNADNLQGAARRHFLKDGAAPAEGDIFRAPGQAEVLRRIAAEGAKAFYEGEVAEDMVAALQAHGGSHTLADFAARKAAYVTSISAPYRGMEIVELPPNSHGATALLLARMAERFDIASMAPFGPERTHFETEATKLAYAARNQAIADPDFMTMKVEDFISDTTAADLAARIDMSRAQPAPVDPLGSDGAPHRETIYITVVDRDRMAVSLIYSVFRDFGSGIASEKFGILFNDRASGFTLQPGHPNEAGGGKRPLHTIIPGMLRQNGRLVMPFGVMGGPYQPAGHLRLVSNVVDFGMDVQTGIDGPRSFVKDGALVLEAGYDDATVQVLADMGHKVVRPDCGIGGAQAIRIDHERGVLIGGSDPRKDGIALGY